VKSSRKTIHLDNNPENVNEDPYGKGWMIKVKMSNPADADALMSAEDYSAIAG
jgi:glycine cleavage system H protein